MADTFNLKKYLSENLLHKNLLTECFYVSQWLDILKKHPEFIDILKKDVTNSSHQTLFGRNLSEVNWNDLHELANIISNFGGVCGLGASDFNLTVLKDFILDDMTDDDFNISEETAKKLFNIVQKYFNNFNTTTDWIPIEYNRLVSRLGKQKANDWLKWQAKFGGFNAEEWLKKYG